MAKYLLDLDEVSYKNLDLVGGKAASLGEMIKAGITVPPGFVVTTEAFLTGMTVELKKEIYEAFDRLDAKLVAVRSSAIAEDSDTASWAGQLESYLNSTRDTLIVDIEKCWNSIRSKRAKEYSDKNNIDESQRLVAVIVETMVESEVSGVMFCANPITKSTNEYLIEAVYGLCEPLVQGQVIPELLRIDKLSMKVIERVKSKQLKMLVYKDGANIEVNVPADKVNKDVADSHLLNQLILLARAVEKHYHNVPQDIEWSWQKGKLYAVQSRPITTLVKSKDNSIEKIKLPSWNNVDLFYWGPSRATPLYMSDFMSAVERFFIGLSIDPAMPDPPETLVLFFDNKMVWLNDAIEFNNFVKAMFRMYEKRDKLDQDINDWRKSVKKIDAEKGDSDMLAEAWPYTLYGEFALYGARDVINERLKRFDLKTRQAIWGTFTLLENSTFMTRIDNQLIESNDPKALAKKYPWINDGYSGVYKTAQSYFTKRLKLLKENPLETKSNGVDQPALINDLGLNAEEIKSLNLTRQLAEMLDERKEWMMRTRRYITKPASQIKYGWLFKNRNVALLNESDTKKLWDRFINFKTTSSSLEGLVACSGGIHYLTGTVTVLTKPTDPLGNDQIIVVPSTSPSYVPHMRKAKAIITDHGGIMSHAAIVARELNLPCVVATKHATKVLKTGDKIIIDLVRGVISK